jgi:hypothetical protein
MNRVRRFPICLFLFVAALAATGTARAQNQPAPSDAAGILQQSEATASTTHKNVLLVFSASWCGPCHLFEAFLHDPTTGPIMDRSFVIARFDVGEHANDKRHSDTPGAVALRTSLGGADPGYPFIVVADPTGKTIVNSYRPVKGKAPGADTNIGYPALPEEIDWFMEMMRQSAPSMSAKEMDTVRQWLKKNNPL